MEGHLLFNKAVTTWKETHLDLDGMSNGNVGNSICHRQSGCCVTATRGSG